MLQEFNHSSIQKDPQVSSYYGRKCKYYYLPIYSETLFSSILSDALGTNNCEDRSSEGLRSSFIKAKMGNYTHVKVPLDRFDMNKINYIHQLSRDFSLGIVFQIATSFLYDEVFFKSLKGLEIPFEVEWVLDNCHYKVLPRLIELSKCYNCHFSIVVHKNLNWENLLSSQLMSLCKTFHLYFPYQLFIHEPFLNCKESHRIVGVLRNKYPEVHFLPPRGVDLWDRRVSYDFDMEPFLMPCYQSQSSQPNIKFSVIIPTYNNQNHIRVVLKHLYSQSVGLDHFEVVLVDDGGTDNTQELVIELIKSFPNSINFKYIYFHRARERVMGDSQYRAGIARNLGVKNSAGEILCFLDSDIMVPSTYLEDVGKALEEWGAVQARRINLSQQSSYGEPIYSKVNEASDCISDEPYWEEFNLIEDWHQTPYNWKYVCTHSFSIKKETFLEVGGIKKNFIFYGFEDTDLGYRLVKAGFKLHLLDVKVFHLYHENARSEFFNLKSLRHMLLSRTAQIFYLHHLDEDIYENLLLFMEPEPTFRRVFHRVIQTLSFQFLWKASPSVYNIKRSQPKRLS